MLEMYYYSWKLINIINKVSVAEEVQILAENLVISKKEEEERDKTEISSE